MNSSSLYKPAYGNSYAIAVGINRYQHVSPLAFAANDAAAIARTLIEKFAFPSQNVITLLDGGATKAEILRNYMKLTNVVGGDDRILFFFAGHGHTVAGRRTTGFLIPADGDIGDISTLIRWDEITRGADLIPAKHMFFVMDACYGGLAVNRKAAPRGSMRLLQDLLQRYARQVLAAGKPDQPVSDGGGTRDGHSIFTSHVLDGLEGDAELADGLITANSLMAYVYGKVGADKYSEQTPHYGSFDGDGDFVFDPSAITAALGGEHEKGGGNTTLLNVPYLPEAEPSDAESLGQRVKGMIPRTEDRIRLDDLVSSALRTTLQELASANFYAASSTTLAGEFPNRVAEYDETMRELEAISILLAHWGGQGHVDLLEKIFLRIAEMERPSSGIMQWLNLAAYPVLDLMYATGISALARGQFEMLRVCLLTPVRWVGLQRAEPLPIILPVMKNVIEIHDLFKSLPGMGNKYFPRSEHQFTALQSVVEDQLFLGSNYEDLFDRFEVMLALVYADVNTHGTKYWGPPGRFAYKERGFASAEKPLSAFVNVVRRQGEAWPGFKVGFFGGSLSQFNEVADGFAGVLSRFNPM